MATNLPKRFLDAIGNELLTDCPSVANPVLIYFGQKSNANTYFRTNYYDSSEYMDWLQSCPKNCSDAEYTANWAQRATFLMFILAAEGVL